MSSKETLSLGQLEDSGSINIDSVLPPEPHPPPPIPDPTGIALLLFALVAVSEAGYRTTRGK